MRLKRVYQNLLGWQVFAGPGRGLRYVSEAVASVRQQAIRAMDEQRPGRMRWFCFEPRSA